MFGLSLLAFLSVASVRAFHPSAMCTEAYHRVPLDHFESSGEEGEELGVRYFHCNTSSKDGNPQAVFVYFGNEADVELYVQNTGLMWESAEEFDADLLFIEHRYYGKSTADGLPLRYLATNQALADFAQIIEFIQKHKYGGHRALPVIGFGGSYGGMIGSFFSYKYGGLIDGVIAASAPIWTYLDEEYDEYGFARIVSEDADKAAPGCVNQARLAWTAMLETPESEYGELAAKMRLCDSKSLKSKEDVRRAVDWLSAAWDMMAIGNYPYASAYLTSAESPMPAWPIREACRVLLEDAHDGEADIVDAMVAAVGIYHNASSTVDCYGQTDIDGLWDFQYCSGDGFMPMSRNGRTDMFYEAEFSLIEEAARCNKKWGVVPDLSRGLVEFGGREILRHISNVVFSNGDLDPWTSGGVLSIPRHLQKSNNLSTVLIKNGAHHLDLFWSHPDDPPSVIDARIHEKKMIRKWIDAFHSRKGTYSEQ